jgi:hypothetical protein
MKFRLTLLILLIINVPLSARDIDLDAIYMKSGSRIYTDIVASKEKIYSDISSLFIDSNVIFSSWSGGDDILYIKEFRGINIIYLYSRGTFEKREMGRFPGTVTAAVNNARGNLVTFKSIFYNDEAEAESRNIHIDLVTGKIVEEKSGSLFLDFSAHPSAREIIKQGRDGIFRRDPFTGTSSKLVPAGDYSDMQCQGDPVIAHISPDGKNRLLVCGSGGSYNARLIQKDSRRDINGIASAGDIRWIGNSRFVYRSGGAGDYSVRVFDTIRGSSFELVSGTMNPDIRFSERAGIITCLDNQIINIFSSDLNSRIETGIEGEETSFSPDGRKMISIYRGKLYVTSLTMLEKYQIEIRRNAANLLDLYRKASTSKNDWENAFTPEYLDKKISQYSKFLKNGKK